MSGAGVKASLTPDRPERPVNVAMLRRCLRALSRNAVDLVALADMVELRDELEGNIIDAVARLRHDPILPASWTDIGRALGTTRQAAQERYGKVGGIRRPGGQPAELR